MNTQCACVASGRQRSPAPRASLRSPVPRSSTPGLSRLAFGRVLPDSVEIVLVLFCEINGNDIQAGCVRATMEREIGSP